MTSTSHISMMSASFDYSASSLKQQSAGRHVATLKRIILNLGQQTPYGLAEKQEIPILSSLVLINVNTCSFKTTDLCLWWQKLSLAHITFDKGAINRKMFIFKNPFWYTLNDVQLQNIKTGITWTDTCKPTHTHFKYLISTHLDKLSEKKHLKNKL